MKIKEAIEKAIEGGWKDTGIIKRDVMFRGEKRDIKEYNIPEVLLDPKFWQALGKSLGWKDHTSFLLGKQKTFYEWQGHWHKLIDHLAEGKDIESYFKEL